MSLAAAHVHAWLGGRHVLRGVSVDVRPGSVLGSSHVTRAVELPFTRANRAMFQMLMPG